jgi:Mn2+/Fe2+ NRAMP family transporter
MRWMDVFTKVLGILMIVLTIYVVIVAEPPWGEALQRTIVPEKIDLLAIITLVGGTVGGYISFAGAHRLIDAGMTGTMHTKAVGKSAVTAILLASVMRILLFLAALGVVAKGVSLDAGNPAASVFELAAGRIGYLLFGVVMWSAAITSVVGSAYTTISFFKSLHPVFEKREKAMLVGFVSVALLIFLVVGKPVKTLVVVGALNGFILPVALILILLAAGNKKITGDYKHPLWLKIFGTAVVAFTLYLSVKTALTVFY